MFDFEQFVEDCKVAVRHDDGKAEIQALVERAVSSPSELLAAIGEPTRAGVNRIHVADDLTILNLVWGPDMSLYPHDHRMWAVIGLYGGREDNTFWRREGETLAQQGTRVVAPGDVCTLGKDVIHSVHNPLQKLTGALHVYGGDFFETPRSEWDPDNLTEQDYSVPRALQMFEDSNTVWESMQREEA
jgi:predicted metal-dependent enzyme (double-stranded beta helix superfamily)